MSDNDSHAGNAQKGHIRPLSETGQSILMGGGTSGLGQVLMGKFSCTRFSMTLLHIEICRPLHVELLRGI
jgi:hypothetical protein